MGIVSNCFVSFPSWFFFSHVYFDVMPMIVLGHSLNSSLSFYRYTTSSASVFMSVLFFHNFLYTCSNIPDVEIIVNNIINAIHVLRENGSATILIGLMLDLATFPGFQQLFPDKIEDLSAATARYACHSYCFIVLPFY